MPDRPRVKPADPNEQLRQIGESMADGYYVCSIIVKNSKRFVPGEAVDELNAAWSEITPDFNAFVTRFDQPQDNLESVLREAGFSGGQGQAKLGMLRRLKERFFRFWNSEPQTKRKL